MEFIEYYKSEKSRIINELTLDKIKKEKQGLLVAIEDKNINSKHIVKIKKIISKRGIEGKLSSIISKILEEDNIFANLFYNKSTATSELEYEIIETYMLNQSIPQADENRIFHPGNGVRWFIAILGEFKENINPSKTYNIWFIDKLSKSNPLVLDLTQWLNQQPNITINE